MDAAARAEQKNREVMRRKKARPLRLTPKDELRFWRKVNFEGPDPYEVAHESVKHFYEPLKGTRCWVWTGNAPQGRGLISIQGRPRLAYRVAWKLLKGSLPRGKDLLHQCDAYVGYGLCVNPAHLRPGTMAENRREAQERGLLNGRWKRGATTCPRGHDLTLPGAIVVCGGRRYCRECFRVWDRAHKRKRRVTDSKWWKQKLASDRAYKRERYASDPEWAEKERGRRRAHYAAHCDEINAKKKAKRALAKQQKLAEQAAPVTTHTPQQLSLALSPKEENHEESPQKAR